MNVDSSEDEEPAKRTPNKMPSIYVSGTDNHNLWNAFVAANEARGVKLQSPDQSPPVGDGFGDDSTAEPLTDDNAMSRGSNADDAGSEGTSHPRRRVPNRSEAPAPPGPPPPRSGQGLIGMTPRATGAGSIRATMLIGTGRAATAGELVQGAQPVPGSFAGFDFASGGQNRGGAENVIQRNASQIRGELSQQNIDQNSTRSLFTVPPRD